ncbi:hypothetical protein ACH5RR_038839 [Cinchona calisaya]|uniref:Bifunctional inhibitor/plant lipid transfer protein/seed storage helical domain-containing protein n=1 Tax=Cinchona calisaya TaxID=153742 RepID=A0ABD2XWG1_9GENT
MGKYYYSWSVMNFLVLLALISSGRAVSDADCRKERRIGMKACKLVTYGYFPSPECCEIIRNTHPECVCPYITPEVAAQINVERAIKLADSCGKKISRPFKCGSLIIPSKWSILDRLRTLFFSKRWFLNLLEILYVFV